MGGGRRSKSEEGGVQVMRRRRSKQGRGRGGSRTDYYS